MTNAIGLFLKELQKENKENVDIMVKKLKISKGFYFAVCSGRKNALTNGVI
jgi:hypothetical protein